MSAASCVDEHHIETLLCSKRNSILGHGSRILAVTLLVELDLAPLARRQLLEVAHVHGELFDGARTERIAGGNEDLVLVLQQEETDLGQVGRLADAVDAHDGDDVRPGPTQRGHGRCGDGIDLAEEVEGGAGCKDLGERCLHGALYPRVDAW